MQRSPWAAWVRTLNGVVPPFINIIGVLFGLTLAFLANDTWNAHDRAMNAVYKEADALRSLVVLASQLEEPQRSQLREALTDYAQASVGEWSLLAQRKSSPEVSIKADRLLVMLGSTSIAKAARKSASRQIACSSCWAALALPKLPGSQHQGRSPARHAGQH